jgi:hypothetical protein
MIELILSARLRSTTASEQGVKDSAGIKLEENGRSINRDRDGLLGNGGLKGCLVIHGNVRIAGELCDEISGLDVASSGGSLVWVSGFSNDSPTSDDILESPLHESSGVTVASTIVDTVNKLLLRETDQGVTSEEVSTLHGTNSGE